MSHKKLRVGVLIGGPSAEREVSLVTGRAIYDNLDPKKYQPFLIEMDKEAKIFLLDKKKKRLLDLQDKDRKLFDLIFIALHGTPGEDGTVQGMLELYGIPYTGSKVMASSIAMNKVMTGALYRLNKLATPGFVDFSEPEWKKEKERIVKEVGERINYPAVVKPADQGSAVGVSIVENEAELRRAIETTITKFSWLMAQRFITGKETTCGVLERNGKLLALPPTRIIPQLGKFYDYESKYAAGGSTHICPADFAPEVNEKIQALALKAHKALGCRGMSRTDIFVGDDGELWVIETNTIPGMTPTSLLPEAAGKAGISFSKMLDMIIEASL